MTFDNKVIFPDYKNSIINLTASILQAFDVQSDHPPLKQLNTLELKLKKNIILLILDGFGLNLFRKYEKSITAFLQPYFLDSITSVFPSTTSAAITSIMTGKTPWEHGAIGWSLYFKEFAKLIDYLPNWDSITSRFLNSAKYNTQDYLGGENIFAKIQTRNPEVLTYNMTLKGIDKSANTIKNSGSARIIGYKKTPQLFRILPKILKKNPGQRKFIYAYSSNPDHLEHLHGVGSQQVCSFLQETCWQLEKLQKKLQGTNTTLLISADHGLVDIGKYFYTNEDEMLFDSMIMPTFPEPRFVSFFIKKHKEDQFLIAIEKYEDDFELYSRQDLINEELLGFGKMHPKIDDFLGDYMMIATGNKAMKSIYMQNGKWKKEFAAHHAGLTAGEMQVPLFRIDL
ncbi:MAG: alkaline phosphatase family protein [Candidatus Cloacimonadales bacterium]|nr:alkaline phosphatase family protein [Candidatus Cloacimonadales bacterium]